MNDKITAACELMAAYMSREQTAEGYADTVKRVYPGLPIDHCVECRGTGWVMHQHANQCGSCNGTGKQPKEEKHGE